MSTVSGASAIDLDTGSGVITTSDALSGGSYVIQGVSGMVNGNAITGLSLFGSADNLLLSPTTPDAFDFHGFGFMTAGESFNLFGDFFTTRWRPERHR